MRLFPALRANSIPGAYPQRRRWVATRASASTAEITEKKQKLLEAIAPLRRGATASKEDAARVDALATELETVTPNPEALASEYINGKWELVYTTSTSILGTSRPPFLRPFGPIYQTIDATNLKARNIETWPFFNQVSADLIPMSKSKVSVTFKQFKIIGLIPVVAPSTFKGELDTTFLDEEMRISRGDKGNLFVLLMDDPASKP